MSVTAISNKEYQWMNDTLGDRVEREAGFCNPTWIIDGTPQKGLFVMDTSDGTGDTKSPWTIVEKGPNGHNELNDGTFEQIVQLVLRSKGAVWLDKHLEKPSDSGWVWNSWEVLRGEESSGVKHFVEVLETEWDTSEVSTLSIVCSNSVSDVAGVCLFSGTPLEVIAVLKAIDAAQACILEEMAMGDLPLGIRAFSQLHDHSDANAYLDLNDDLHNSKLYPCEMLLDPHSSQHEKAESAVNCVIDVLNIWLACGGHEINKNAERWIQKHLGRDIGLNASWNCSAWQLTGDEQDNGLFLLDGENDPYAWTVVSRVCDSNTDLDEIHDIMSGSWEKIQPLVVMLKSGGK